MRLCQPATSAFTVEQDAFVERVVKTGEYQSASEAIRAALRVLQQKRREETLKLRALRAQMKAGLDALERGDYTQVADTGIDGYLERLAATPGKGAP